MSKRKYGLFDRNANIAITDEELVWRQPKGTRFVKNEVTVLGGQYSGIMKSGRSVTVSGDGVIPVEAEPGVDTVCWFNGEEFVQEAVVDKRMRWIWETTSADEDMEIPIYSGYNYDMKIDWGDGTVDTYTGDGSTKPLHTYATAGEYEISITGLCESIKFYGTNEKSKLKNVLSFGDTGLKNIYQALRECDNISSIDVGTNILDDLIEIREAFRAVSATEILNLDHFDVSGCTRINMLFAYATALTTIPNVSNWDTSNITEMELVFQSVENITTPPDVSEWDTSNVTTMRGMYRNMTNITEPPDFSNWDVSKVETFVWFMQDLTGLTTPPDFSNWNTASVKYLESFFRGASSLGEIGDIGVENFNISNLLNGQYAFYSMTFSISAYDKILINWAAQSPNIQDNVTMHFGNSKYTPGGAAEDARDVLTGTHGWNLSDGGPA